MKMTSHTKIEGNHNLNDGRQFFFFDGRQLIDVKTEINQALKLSETDSKAAITKMLQ